MNAKAEVKDCVNISVENIGGIDETAVTFDPGVTLLIGQNATNRTSLLQAIMAACGSDNVSIKGDADEAHVELSIGDATYTRHLRRQNGRLVTEGEPYLEDTEAADLFAFLLETNEVRQAVAQAADLRELVMRPVDTDAIQAEIDRLSEKKRDLEAELDELNSLENRLPTLEEKRSTLTEEIETIETELADAEASLDNIDADVETTREDEAELEATLDALRDKREELERVRYNIETVQEVITDLREEQENLQTKLENLPSPSEDPVAELEAEIERLHERERTLETEIDELQSVIQFNEQMLEDRQDAVVQALEAEDGDDSAPVTDQLVADETTTCWTCGSEVAGEEIQSTLEELREVNQARRAQIDEIQTELSEYKASLQEIQTQQKERTQTERRLTEIDKELADRTDRLDELTEKRDALEAEITDLEAEVEALEGTIQDDVLDLHKEANDLQFELGKLEREREDVDAEIEEIEDRLAERDAIEDEKEAIQTEIEDLRTKIERLERQVIEEFNDHMDTILDLLEYENVDRIWLERVTQDTGNGRRTEPKTTFELHVIRSTESGTTYEDTIDHLSASEREVTGLVFALAGYLAHEVHEELPLILLDSLEAIDAERLAILIDYLADVTDYLLAALLPEDAAVLDEEYDRITEI